ncbi:hypothetical protein [Halorubrum sp. AS12]|uniref:hypothetical protein n=1 Tax=Halorubrum sp. AS12 TaxID=3409687 RepID=UPI003DA71B73
MEHNSIESRVYTTAISVLFQIVRTKFSRFWSASKFVRNCVPGRNGIDEENSSDCGIVAATIIQYSGTTISVTTARRNA